MANRVLRCSLRGDFVVNLELPEDFNKQDASRLKRLLDFEAQVQAKVERKRTPRKKPVHSVIDEVSGK